jgi:hypothetical protein
MRIELSDRNRLGELREFFRNAHAVATIEGQAVIVHLPDTPSAADDKHLRAYLETWLRFAAAWGNPVGAEVSSD